MVLTVKLLIFYTLIHNAKSPIEIIFIDMYLQWVLLTSHTGDQALFLGQEPVHVTTATRVVELLTHSCGIIEVPEQLLFLATSYI